MATDDSEFEFWRDLPQTPRKSFEEIYEEQSQPTFVEVSKRREERKQSNANKRRNNSVRFKALIAACLIGLGIGIAKIADFVAPYISAYHTYESNRLTIARIAEDYKVNGGYLLSLELDYEDEERGFFDDAPREFDYDSPENVWVTESGRKVGPLVDYFDGLDNLVSEYNGGKGYYELVYEMNEIDKMFGREPSTKCVYTQEELAEMFSEESTNQLEESNGKGL